RSGDVHSSSRARLWISAERACWSPYLRTVVSAFEYVALIVVFGFSGIEWLFWGVLKEAGDAFVIEPVDARDSVRTGAEAIRSAGGPAGRGGRRPKARASRNGGRQARAVAR